MSLCAEAVYPIAHAAKDLRELHQNKQIEGRAAGEQVSNMQGELAANIGLIAVH